MNSKFIGVFFRNFTEIVLSTTIHFPLVPLPVYPPILPYPLDKIVPPLMKETVGILGNMGKFADKAVKDLFNGVSDTAKRLGKILKTRIQLPRIAFRAPRIRLPRIKVHVPRIRLPRIAYRAPRVRLPRFSFRAPSKLTLIIIFRHHEINQIKRNSLRFIVYWIT